MFLVSVIPISRGIATDSLSYFSKEAPKEGSVVTVPLRKKTAHGLVIKVSPAQEAKSEIKNADFELKKIEGRSRTIFSQSFIKTAEEAATYHTGTIGGALYEIIPKAILTHLDTVLECTEPHYVANIRQHFVLQENDDDRFAHYKGIVREKFAKKRSVFLLMPTIEDLKKGRAYLEKGIQDYTYVFHSDMTQKETVDLWNKALREKHPILIIGTSIFLSLPRSDIGMIIVEKDNSRGYKNIGRPFLDMRYVAERLAKNIGADFLIGDSCLRVETIERHNEGDFVEFAPLSFRSLSTATDELIDMKKYSGREDGFRVLSDEFINLIKTNKENNELLFVFAARRGVSPSTVCSDCEDVLSCAKCNTPLILHGKDDYRFFLCNHCGKKYDAKTTCKKCGSWRLKPLGIGSELVEEKIKEILPDTKIFRIDKTVATTHKKAVSIAEKWMASPGSILIGTEMALTYIDKKIDNCAIATLDSYFSIPDFRISEKIFSIILKMRSLAHRRFLLQTRRPDEALLSYAWKGNMIDFFREEIILRRALNFPPFSVLVKLSSSGTKERVTEDMKTIKTLCSDYDVDVFPAFVSLPRGHVGMHALIRIEKKSWPDKKLIQILETLPQSFTVNIDPESLL